MIGLVLGIPLGITYLLIKLYQVFTNKYIIKRNILLIFGVLGVALLAAQIDPPIGWDLYRHYEEIDRMRQWGATYVWNDSHYVNYYGATALFYIASLTPWNETLPFLTIFFELLIYEKIADHYRWKISAQSEGICFFLFLVLSNIVLAISGIRNVLAVILINYAIWDFECLKKGNLIKDIIIVLVAITIHPASGFLIMIYGLTFIPWKIVGIMLATFILPTLTNFVNNFTFSTNAFLSSSAGLFGLYTQEQIGLDIRVRITSVILIVFSIFLISKIMIYKKERYLFFAILYSLATLGMITQGLIYSRMLYGLDILYPILIINCCKNKKAMEIAKTTYWYKVYCLIYCSGMLLFQGYELARAILIR